MSENQEYRDRQGHDRDKSVQEDINERLKGQAEEANVSGKELSAEPNQDSSQSGKESTGTAENNQGNWSGNYGKVDATAQGSVMPEFNNTADDGDKPETKIPPSFIEADGKTGTQQNDTNPSKAYHGNPVTTYPNTSKNETIPEEGGVHAENIGGTSEEEG